MKIRKICAAIVSAALITGVCTEAICAAADKSAEIPEGEVFTADENSTSAADAVTKDETVYVITGADGSTNKIIVSDHLKNVDGDVTITDYSTLSDIENVKGYEEFSVNGYNIVWNAGGNDIYYQGISKTETPVEMKITYSLDGKEISARELAGKSGKIKIRVDYINHLAAPVEINGVTENVDVPFAFVTGTLLNNDTFRNIRVLNGKVIDDGDKTAIVALTFPKLKESLKIDSDKLDIPDYIEITADVKNFEFGGFYAVAGNSVFSNISIGDVTALDDLKTAAEKMNIAMTQLIDGSSLVYGGLSELDKNTGELISGIEALNQGAVQLRTGAEAIDAGTENLCAGIEQLYSGSSNLSTGLSALDENSELLNAGAGKIFASLLTQADGQLAAQGLELPKLTAENYAAVLDGVAGKVELAMGKEAAGGILALKAQLDEVKGFCDGLNAYTGGVSSACAGAKSIQKGTTQLVQGADKLKSGTASLKEGTASLSDGIGSLATGGKKIAEGISALKEGAGRLNNGLIQFNEEAIGKLVEAADGDLGRLAERLCAVSDAAGSYRNYSGLAGEADGSIRFIFKTAEIVKQ